MKNLFISIIIFCAHSIMAQTAVTKEEQTPYIEVLGSSEKEIVPDEIYVEIVLRERFDNKLKITIEEQEKSLMKALLSIGISLDRLTLSDANANVVKINWKKNDLINKKEYTLKLSTAQEVGAVYTELDKIEITQAHITRVTHSKLDSLKKELRIEAIKNAKEKADYLLKAIGEQTGSPLIVKEVEKSSINYVENVSGRGARGGMDIDKVYLFEPELKGVIQFQKIKIQSQIYVKFGIK
jgi:uncharacterized protein YggE